MTTDKDISENIQRILKELVNTSLEQWLLGATDMSEPLDKKILSVKDQLEKSRKEATYKILEMFEVKEPD